MATNKSETSVPLRSDSTDSTDSTNSTVQPAVLAITLHSLLTSSLLCCTHWCSDNVHFIGIVKHYT